MLQAMLQRIVHGGGARGDANLAVDGRQVAVDRARADHELVGDLRIAQPLGQQLEHLALAGGEIGWGAGGRQRSL